ncbi:MAG: dihydrodipicolinate synthase family protein [Candidatus Caldatribacteriota bacterium]|nr:dihydrodipicolinate synthase family protein [Candidatus Caldatribacteriota bacterium]
MINFTGKKKLEGVIPALVLPVNKEGKINFILLEKQVAYLILAGVNGLFINGTTGEGAWLTTDEKEEVFKVVKEISEGKVFLCAACIQPFTEMVINEIKAFEKLEPDYIVAVTPYYYSVSQNVIIEHFKKIAQYSSIPLIIYNIPQCTHNKIELSTVLRLTQEENIAGVKDSSGDFVSFTRGVYTSVPESFSWIQGEDYLDGPAFNCGANGIVTGLGNVFIEPYIQMYEEAKKGNATKVNDIQIKINELYEIIQVSGGKVIPAIKTGVALLGRSTNWMKISSQTLSKQEVEKVKIVLRNLNLINAK